MTVKELIDKLNEYPEEMDIYFTNSGWANPATHVQEMDLKSYKTQRTKKE